MRGKKRKILACIIAIIGVTGLAVAANYMLQKADDDICAAAISNLSGNLEVVSVTADRLLATEVENLQKIAFNVAEKENPQAWIEDYCTIDGMTAVELVMAENLAEDGGGRLPVPVETLDFSDGRTAGGLPISKSCQGKDGQWYYALSCPVIVEGEVIGTLYGEITWRHIEAGLPSRLYGEDSVFLLLDGMSDNVIDESVDTELTEFSGCHSLDDFLETAGLGDDFMKDVFYGNKQNGMSVVFQYDMKGQNYFVYMWPVDDGNVYFLGLVPMDEIMQEIPIVRHTIKFIVLVACLVSGIVIAVILIESLRRQKMQKAREIEREAHNQQLQEALDYAKAANASKTMFLSNMSHDIRTPMNAIIGFSSLLSADPSNEEKVREYTEKITASSQHLMNLINEILDISKIESGNVVLNIEKFSVKNFINEIEVLTRPMMEARHQKYMITLEDLKYDWLLGDATRLTQIMVNLLTNASKYTHEYGEIFFTISEVKVSDKFERIRFEVKDTGIGISKEYQKIIFEPFTRAENSMTNKVQGTGLGMAITKNLVDMMGGTIEIRSKEGAGSNFCVEISFRVSESKESKTLRPDGDKNMDVVSQKEPDVVSGTLEGARFLVAEDNELNIEIIWALLEAEKVRCDTVENGLLAVDAFKSHDPGTYDAILMDVMMPVMDGYEATRTIRHLKRSDAGEIPIIAITANAFSEDIKKALNAGMNAHLSKPLNIEALRRTLLPLIKK